MKGLTINQVAKKFNLSPRTVEDYMSDLIKYYKAKNAVHLAGKMVEFGYFN